MNSEISILKNLKIDFLRFLFKSFKYFDYKFTTNKINGKKLKSIKILDRKKGWHLTFFYQNNYQNNIIGKFIFRKSFFKQTRKYKRGKLIYRIIHLNKNSNLKFKLNQKVDLFEFNIIRIPSILAYFIILKNNLRNGSFYISKLNFSRNWYYYNKAFYCQTKRRPLIPYCTYIKLIEPKYTKIYVNYSI